MDFTMKVALLLFLFCLAEADDVRQEFDLKIQQLKSQLEAKISDMASRLSASEAKTAELQTRLNQLHDDMKMRHCESPGWQKFDRGCYYISTEKKTWEESRQWCRDRQSDLIVIKSKAKQDFVANFNKRVHLGLTDKDEEGIWMWVDGTPLTTPTYWRSGEPHGESDTTNAEQDCVEYYDGSVSGRPNRGWNDVGCHPVDGMSIHTLYWMCERALC